MASLYTFVSFDTSSSKRNAMDYHMNPYGERPELIVLNTILLSDLKRMHQADLSILLTMQDNSTLHLDYPNTEKANIVYKEATAAWNEYLYNLTHS